ncbi:DUF5694 domain-containing protein [Niallia alba]|uniref:DUF5694 domain-containing protein n=1 Tax=Niallia alba TaxID=2729105 RepID=UPI002E1CAC11|nr:DUF5694 domain-containing protein [Niallia alba]
MKKKIILIGTFHFEENVALIKTKEDEVKELVELLAEWKPSKIAVEWEKNEENLLNERYKKISNKYSIDEIEHIGFRLAKKLEHNKLYGVNWEGELVQEDVKNLFNEIQENYSELFGKIESLNINGPVISTNYSLIESFCRLNENINIQKLEQLYLSFVIVENKKGEKIGINFLDKWMKRELTIFKNMIDISRDRTEECILLVIGSDHIWMLRRLFEGFGWEVINPFLNLENKMECMMDRIKGFH